MNSVSDETGKGRRLETWGEGRTDSCGTEWQHLGEGNDGETWSWVHSPAIIAAPDNPDGANPDEADRICVRAVTSDCWKFDGSEHW